MGYIRRITADFKNFNGTESATAATVTAANALTGGTKVFEKTFFLSGEVNTVYVTISTTGDTHFSSTDNDQAALWLSCKFDGAFCNPGAGGAAGAPGGWIAMLKLTDNDTAAGGCSDAAGGGAGDCHDNIIYYTWCIPLGDDGDAAKSFGGDVYYSDYTMASAGTHTVELRMASSNGGAVFFEAAHFYIDASKIHGDNRCTQAPALTPG
jgi:hypothetical protein